MRHPESRVRSVLSSLSTVRARALRRSAAVALAASVALLPTQQAKAQTEPESRIAIEQVMRDLQVRYVFLHPGSPHPWPECCYGSSSHPVYPADGFYGDYLDPDCAAGLVADALNVFEDIMGAFYKTGDVESLEGSADGTLNQYGPQDFGLSGVTVNEGNYQAVLNIIQAGIPSLKYVIGSAALSAVESRGGADTSDYASYVDCQHGWSEFSDGVQQIWDTGWHGGSGAQVHTWDGASFCSQGSVYVFYNLNASRGHGKVKFAACQPSGSVKLWFKCTHLERGVGANSPPDGLSASGTFHFYMERAASGTDWESDWINDGGLPTYDYSCSNPPPCCNPPPQGHLPECEYGWTLEASRTVQIPDFTVPTWDTGECTFNVSVLDDDDSDNEETAGPVNGSKGDTDCGKKESAPTPAGKNPVVLSTGHKIEEVVDLSVTVNGKPFNIVRQYLSNPDLFPHTGKQHGLVGENWTMNVFPRMRDESTGGQTFYGFTGPSGGHETYRPQTTRWVAWGPNHRYAIYSTTQNGITEVTLVGPNWKIHYRVPVPTLPVGLRNRVYREDDEYGNYRTYVYNVMSTSASTPNEDTARLAAIYFNGAPEGPTPEAIVRFNWYTSPVTSAGAAARRGRLESVAAYRRNGSGNWIMTDQVLYTYMVEGGTAPGPGTGSGSGTGLNGLSGGGTLSANLGTNSDLIQVTKRERVDSAGGTLPFRTTITQYRYHDGQFSATNAEDERLNVRGKAHQLKMVINAEQIEHLAAEIYPTLTGTIPPELLVERTANQLLITDDDGQPYTNSPAVLEYAAKIVAYGGTANASPRVSVQYLQTSCGCGGGATQGVKENYSYFTYTGGFTTRVTQQERGTSGWLDHLIYSYDMKYLGSPTPNVPFLYQKAIEEPGQNGRQWVYGYDYDGNGNCIREFMPSALSGPYVRAQTNTVPTYNVSATSGLVYAYSYTNDWLSETRVGNGALSSFSAFAPVSKITYPTNPGTNERDYLPTMIERYTSASSQTADTTETTTFTYGFRSNDSMAWMKTTVEGELQAENGPDGSVLYDSYELYDDKGNNVWSRGPDMALTNREFDVNTGQVTAIHRNADLTGLNGANFAGLVTSGWTNRVTDGGTLTTTYAVDLLGRTIRSTTPGNVSAYTIREMRANSESPGLFYFADVGLPHSLGDHTYDGPARINWSTASNRSLRASEFSLMPEGPYDPPHLIYTLRTAGSDLVELARSATVYHMSGLAQARKAWHSLTDNPDTTTYTYDQLGQVLTTTDANGTITRSSYDSLGRTVATEVGTDSSPTLGNMQTVAEYFYDGGASATQGQGDGRLTMTREHTGESGTGALSSQYRDTIRSYDFRGRLVKIQRPTPPHEFAEYDNQDRVTKRALFDSVPTGIGNTQDTTRGMYMENLYSQRGLKYRQRAASDPKDLAQAFLESNTWFDAAGRSLSEWRANAPGLKRVLDAHGRASAIYITDRGGDAAIGAQGNYTSATTLTGDIVLEQTLFTYGSGLSTPVWPEHLVLSKIMRRAHDGVGTGDLRDLAAVNSVASYVAFYYDAADRRVRTVNFGTNASADQFSNGSAPSWPPSAIPEPGYSTNALVSGVTYDERGLVQFAMVEHGPAGGTPGYQITETLYDALGRAYATIENYSTPQGNPLTIEWGQDPLNSSLYRWKVTSGLDAAHSDRNRVTSFVFDGVGNVVMQVAHLPGSSSEKVQITQYAYGTAVGTVSTDTNSLVASGSLLKEVAYPQESGTNAGQPGTGDDLKVKYSYNGLGELRTVVDQNATKHTYARDGAGRVLTDSAAFGTNSPIDQRIKQIGITYDNFGRMSIARSFDQTSPSHTANAVELTYTPLWQVENVFQDYDGDVQRTGNTPTGNTALVHYTYSQPTPPGTGASNYSRLTGLTYPDGTVVNYRYGSTNIPQDNAISRVTSMDFGTSDPILNYARVGLDMFAIVDYGGANVQLDRTFSQDGKRRWGTYTTQNAGVYPGWDRYGRVTIQPWLDGAVTTGTNGNPNRPPIVDEAYSYDYGSNRITKVDARPGARLTNKDVRYTYDGLDRLTEARTGLPTTWATGPALGSQDWALDMLGNWVTTRKELGGSTAYGDAGETENRDHNSANEIVNRYPNGTGNTPTLPFAYDPAGNLRDEGFSINTSNRFTHDAWNRLVKRGYSGEVMPTGGSEYEYNGLHWRTIKRRLPDYQDMQGHGNGELRFLYYSATWQLLQESIDDDYTGSPGLNRIEKEVWGLRYIDDPVMRWNTVIPQVVAENDLPIYDESQAAADAVNYDAAPAPAPAPAPVNLNRFYHITDVQFSTVAMIGTGSSPTLFERVRYDAYGQGTHRWPADFNDDGNVNGTDQTTMTSAVAASPHYQIGDTNYDVSLDLNRDGVIDTGDQTIFNTWNPRSPLAAGQISNPGGADNDIGFDGYVFAPEVSLYCVRLRWLSATQGRWLERDPLGYADGMSSYEESMSCPNLRVDPLGLSCLVPGTNKPLERASPGEILKGIEQEAKSCCKGGCEEARRKLILKAANMLLAGTQPDGIEITDELLKAMGEAGEKINKQIERWKKVLEKTDLKGDKDGLKGVLKASEILDVLGTIDGYRELIDRYRRGNKYETAGDIIRRLANIVDSKAGVTTPLGLLLKGYVKLINTAAGGLDFIENESGKSNLCDYLFNGCDTDSRFTGGRFGPRWARDVIKAISDPSGLKLLDDAEKKCGKSLGTNDTPPARQ